MFYSPQEVLKAAANGLSLWADYIVPALFPFFIISDLLMKQGFVHFLGALLEPVMRPVFRLPGKASFIIAMTHTAGIPIGAMLTCQMRNDGDLTRGEAERLLAFTSNPSPGFMFGAVASGMLGNPGLGIVLAGSVYLSNLLVGLIFRFYGDEGRPLKSRSSIYKAWREVELAQKKNNKPLGDIMAESIRHSISTILLVGGFIVFFSVITHIMTLWHFTPFIAQALNKASGGLIPFAGGQAFIQGIMETTLGCKATADAFSSLNAQIGMLAFLLGWGGISVFAQVASFTSGTDLRFAPFVLGRTLHAFLAAIVSQILLVFTDIPTAAVPPYLIENSNPWLFSMRWSLIAFSATMACLLLLGMLARHKASR